MYHFLLFQSFTASEWSQFKIVHKPGSDDEKASIAESNVDSHESTTDTGEIAPRLRAIYADLAVCRVVGSVNKTKGTSMDRASHTFLSSIAHVYQNTKVLFVPPLR